MGITTTVLLIVIFGYAPLSAFTSTENQAIQMMCAISDVYSELEKQSVPNPHNITFPQNPSNFIDTIENLNSLGLFSADYNNQIFLTFFNNSCQTGGVPGVYCGTTFANGSNPFLSGLLYYFNNMVFDLNYDESAVNPSTGVLGGPFRDLFIYLVNRNNV